MHLELRTVPDSQSYASLIDLAWQEDYHGCDLTSEATITKEKLGRAALVVRESGVLAGMPMVVQVLKRYDRQLALDIKVKDGELVSAGQAVGMISGPVRTLLAAERVVLNFLQRLSGIATQTRRYVAAVSGYPTQICDTRKTTPGWRVLEKYAVRCGGGYNHRQGLYDAALIKDNHLASLNAPDLVSGLKQAIQLLKAGDKKPAFIQVEVDTLDQLRQVLCVEGIDIVLLDNMTDKQMVQAVALRDQAGLKGRVQLEASGGITLERLPSIAATGVDRISVGALTHSVRTLDIGLDMIDDD